MTYSGIIYLTRTLAARFAGKAPVQKRHQLAAGMVVCGSLCFSLLIFLILYNIFPQLENIFDVWYGGICFFAGMLVLTVGWEEHIAQEMVCCYDSFSLRNCWLDNHTVTV